MKRAFLDKLIGRVGRLQPGDLQAYLAELAREKGFLETLFNVFREGVIVTDLEGRVLYVNRAAGEFFGAAPADWLGRRLEEVVRGLPWAELSGRGGVVSRDLEVFYPEHRLLNFYCVPVYEEGEGGGVAVGSAIILRDTTESRRATEEAIENESLSAITLLAAGVAHEIGNPLNSLDIHLQLLQRKARKLPAKARAEIEETLSVTREEVARLDHIITQFLRAIRNQPPVLRPGNLNEVIRESLAFLETEIRDHDVLVETEFDDALPVISMDAGQIKQVVYNVIRNALQAMASGGILRVRTETLEQGVRMVFADTGGGMPPEVISRIFEPYFTTKAGGSGLGLFIVRRIVRAHGGDISIESTPDKGLVLSIRLPRDDQRVRLLPAGDQEG